MLPAVLLVISLCITTISCVPNQTEYKNELECEELCSLAEECYATSNYELETCTAFCVIEGWSAECLDCRFIDECEKRVECGYKHCDMRPSAEDCTDLCKSFETCYDEYLDIQTCVNNCTTNRNMFECVQCLDNTDCKTFIPCVYEHCRGEEW